MGDEILKKVNGERKMVNNFYRAPSMHLYQHFTTHDSPLTCNKAAFTLAEVLITLGIISIVAAMTIPTLINKYQEKQTVTQLKKIYSILSQSYMNATENEGTPDGWNLIGTDNGEGATNMLNVFSKYMKFQKICGTNTGCFPNVDYTNLDDNGRLNFEQADYISKAILADGTLFYFQVNSSDCTAYNNVNNFPLTNNCGTIAVDINGFKSPNKKGKDLFYFMMNKSGIYPFGMKDDNVVSFETKCYGNGFGCSAWVIYNANLDYLHCNDLSWNGKTKCD